MKRNLWILTVLSVLCGCEHGEQVFLGSKCNTGSDCGDLVCVDHVCIEPCTSDSCASGQACLAEGICVDASTVQCMLNVPCADARATCVYGQCEIANSTIPECSSIKPCPEQNQTCNDLGKCVEQESNLPECTTVKPCADANTVCDLAVGVCVERCTSESCGAGYICSSNGFCQERCTGESCGTDRLCLNGICIDKCTETSCAEGEFCGADGICTAMCSPSSCSSGTVCASSGKCEPTCSAGKCSDGQVCGDDGFCVTAECSGAEPCDDGQVCSYGVCYDVALASCYHDRECPDGYHCDNLKCVDENSCSMTRTCAGSKICLNGFCVEPDPVGCDKQNPCLDASKTCVAGRCITCACESGQSCAPDGTCKDTAVSSDGQYKVGDACEWSSFTPFCDNNRQFLCVDGKVSATDCGANICTTASEEGLGCHEPCTTEGAYYGVCVDLYEYYIAFTHVCEHTPEGMIWTLKHGYEECEVGCTDGRCDFVPEEFGTACTEQSYPDACQGDWLTYCYSAGTVKIAAGTLCTTLSETHFCALPSPDAQKETPGLIGTCAVPCQTKGEISQGCIADGDGGEYSMTYICAETTTGVLADFELNYEACTKGCNVQTGLCL